MSPDDALTNEVREDLPGALPFGARLAEIGRAHV